MSSNEELITISFMLTGYLSKKELLKLILLLTSWYFKDKEEIKC